MDLDASLDDIIKQKRPNKQQQKKDNKQSSKGNKNPQQKHTIKHSQNKSRQPPPQRQQQQKQKQNQSAKKSGILGRLGPNGIQKQSKTTMKQTQLRGLNTPLVSIKKTCGLYSDYDILDQHTHTHTHILIK